MEIDIKNSTNSSEMPSDIREPVFSNHTEKESEPFAASLKDNVEKKSVRILNENNENNFGVVDEEDINCEIKNNQTSTENPSTSGVSQDKQDKLINSLKRLVLDRNSDSDDEKDDSRFEAIVSNNCSGVAMTRDRPKALHFPSGQRRILKISPEDLPSPDSPYSDDEDQTMNDFLSPDTDSNTENELEDSIIEQLNSTDKIPELSLQEERADLKNWKACTIGGVKRQIDMKVIEPYKRVLSHGGYLTSGSHNAIITFCACFLPHKSRKDYNYVMDNLFFYILYTLNELVTDDYVLVYLHGGTSKDCVPTFSWMKRCYQMIDRKLKKNLKSLYMVHPTFLLKTIVTMIKPFISSKFSQKMHFVESLAELCDLLPIEEASIPDRVKQYDRIKLSMVKK